MLKVQDARAKYISTVLADPQRPFIWEYFRPGTIPLPGENNYYDEVNSTNPYVVFNMLNPPIRKEEDGFSPNLSSAHFLFILPTMVSKLRFPPVTPVQAFALLVPWPLPPLR
jgi:hypothetical protein